MKSTPEPIAAAGPRFLRLRRRSLLAAIMSLAAAVMVAIALILAAGRPAFAASSSGISGTVVDGTSGKSVGGLEVTLHILQGGSEIGTDTTTTEPDGSFAFPSAGGAEGVSYVVSVPYQGAEYQTGEIEVALAERADVSLQVYEPTDSPEGITQAEWTVWVDREGQGFAVQQDVEVRNDGDRSYVGSEKIQGGHVVWQMPLAPGASNFQYLGSFIQCCGVVRDGAFVHTAPIPPGKSIATIRYSVPKLEQLSFTAVFPTDEFTLLVPSDIAVKASGLTASGTTTDRNVTYQIYSATKLSAGSTVGVTPTEGAATTEKAAGGATKSTLMTAVGVLAVIFGVAIAVFLYRGRPAPRSGNDRRAPAKARVPQRPDTGRARPLKSRPVPARKARSAPAARGAGRIQPGSIVDESEEDELEQLEAEDEEELELEAEAELQNGDEGEELEDEEDLILDEIAALDLAYERGLLDEKRHRRLRSAAKARLLALHSGAAVGRRS